jgi:hypothetical protein
MIRPRVWKVPAGYPPHHQYVRRYWVAVLGAGAVADLLRLMRAAERSQTVRRPTNTPALARAGLVVEEGGALWVRSLVPPLPEGLLRRLPQSMQRSALAEKRPPFPSSMSGAGEQMSHEPAARG